MTNRLINLKVLLISIFLICSNVGQAQDIKTAYFAGGCFWCTEAIFQRLKGVEELTSGYIGGTVKNPAYREVCSGRTGHAEGVKILFDPQIITYRTLLTVFFATHDPTTLNRQGNDVGTQYRSSIFYINNEQKIVAEKLISELQNSTFDDPIVTDLIEEMPFYNAEKEHHNYYNDHNEQPYCSYLINPKIQKLKKKYLHLLKTP